MRRFVLLLAIGAVIPAAQAADPPPAVADGLKAIKAVGPEGAGAEAAAKGWKAVVRAGAPALIPPSPPSTTPPRGRPTGCGRR